MGRFWTDYRPHYAGCRELLASPEVPSLVPTSRMKGRPGDGPTLRRATAETGEQDVALLACFDASGRRGAAVF